MGDLYLYLIPAGCIGALFLAVWLQRVMANRVIGQLEGMVNKGGESTRTYDQGYLVDARKKLDLARQHRTAGRWIYAYSCAREGRDLLRSRWARYRS